MSWIVFSYSLPSKSSSSPRVALWRRLRRIGAISLKGGINVLPARDECIEAFQWLAQEVQQAKGEALVMRVERFEGLADEEIIELFRTAKSEEYQEIETQAIELEKVISSNSLLEERSSLLETLEKLRKQHTEIARVDFFDCPDGQRVITILNRIAQALSARGSAPVEIPHIAIAQYQNRQWVTRPRPYIDRLACIWLIRRFIDSNAVIRYAHEVVPGEVAFEMKDATFGHCGNLCTFEVMTAAFGLNNLGMQAIGEIVHEIDLCDGLYAHPETAGIDTLLRGWLLANLEDAELENCGIKLFEGLYAVFSQQQS
ncbi:chromate resistance protein ChrB domain-containing protein [Tolypothrix sp. PCC 7910]|uniref:chromate resistance protein ChrB domain-containing protein n=1 Tax=Tolypothrix sp. PCC 7910 TaxID=2099387 RepID=UPI001FCC3EE2|nr:chromate resistance protein ChrB domain-containing protein [Tolypothrix sp. PCC 7910]